MTEKKMTVAELQVKLESIEDRVDDLGFDMERLTAERFDLTNLVGPAWCDASGNTRSVYSLSTPHLKNIVKLLVKRPISGAVVIVAARAELALRERDCLHRWPGIWRRIKRACRGFRHPMER